MGERNQKSFGRKKCWGSDSRHRYFFGTKAVAGTLSFPLDLIPLPTKNKGSQIGYEEQKRGKQDAFGKTRERNGRRKRMKLKRTPTANGTGCRE